MNDMQMARLLIDLLKALLDVVQAAGKRGVPAGELYAELMVGMPNLTADQFSRMMQVLVQAGRVRHSNHCYYVL